MSEEIKKSFSGEPMKADARKDIDLINRYALKELKPEEVFCFSMNLCDTQVDRDNEMFSIQGLQKLARLFPGKPLISDHECNQQGRIYRCQVVTEGDISRLRASIYMLRTAGTEETIRQIEAGILKEVSIGFANKKLICSICGEEMTRSFYGPSKCKNDHEKGNVYNGKTCVGIMADPTDAYEVSFVAVPSQREAGVTKGHGNMSGLSPEEWAERKRIVEESNGISIPDEAWNAVIQGKASGSEMVAALRKQQEKNAKPKSYGNIIPTSDDSPGNILFALIPNSVIPKSVMIEVWKALGFCRKELQLQPISVGWFAAARDVKRLGLDLSTLKTFRYDPNCVGLASRQNPNQILLRFPLDNADYQSDRQKTVFHECWHTFQMKDEWCQLEEDNAYWYMEDAYKRYCALSADEKEELYYGELLMKDYSK